MSYFNMVCDSCGREVQGITWVNGMKFCAKCYQETFGNQQNKESSELLINLLAEKDKQVGELKKQLEEKEKDNQFLKKMYLSERTKNDNYHTEKYGLDKPVEELRKIKLNPKEKEIYYKGFDNCERQFATHIAELEQQLKEKEKKIEKLREGLSQCEADRKFEQEKKNIAWKRVKELESKLCSQPAEIVEKIRKSIHYYLIALLDSDKEPRIKTLGISKEVLDTILEKYQK